MAATDRDLYPWLVAEWNSNEIYSTCADTEVTDDDPDDGYDEGCRFQFAKRFTPVMRLLVNESDIFLKSPENSAKANFGEDEAAADQANSVLVSAGDVLRMAWNTSLYTIETKTYEEAVFNSTTNTTKNVTLTNTSKVRDDTVFNWTHVDISDVTVSVCGELSRHHQPLPCCTQTTNHSEHENTYTHARTHACARTNTRPFPLLRHRAGGSRAGRRSD
jgi:hypothetical protein